MAGHKRKVKDEPIILDATFLPDLYQKILKIQWPYKTNRQQLQQRDQALAAFYLLTGIRNAEHQTIHKKQLRNYKTHILLVNVQPSKRGKLREEIILPKAGGLAPFTEIFEAWLTQVPDENSVLFPTAKKSNGQLQWDKPMQRGRIHNIIKSTTGLFPHWFRGACETIYGKQIFKNDAWALKDFMGLQRLDSTAPYVSSQWKIYEKNISKI